MFYFCHEDESFEPSQWKKKAKQRFYAVFETILKVVPCLPFFTCDFFRESNALKKGISRFYEWMCLAAASLPLKGHLNFNLLNAESKRTMQRFFMEKINFTALWIRYALGRKLLAKWLLFLERGSTSWDHFWWWKFCSFYQ